MESKPGYKTTEFWFTVLASLVTLADLSGVWNWASNWHGGIVGGAVLIAYNLSRGIAKQGIAYTPPAS